MWKIGCRYKWFKFPNEFTTTKHISQITFVHKQLSSAPAAGADNNGFNLHSKFIGRRSSTNWHHIGQLCKSFATSITVNDDSDELLAVDQDPNMLDETIEKELNVLEVFSLKNIFYQNQLDTVIAELNDCNTIEEVMHFSSSYLSFHNVIKSRARFSKSPTIVRTT